MDRRNLLKNAGLILFLNSLPITIVDQFVLKDIKIHTDQLAYLKNFTQFNEIVKILKRYGKFKLQHQCGGTGGETSGESTKSNRISIITLNKSYGRWSNFDYKQLQQAVITQPELFRNLYIKTEGPDGKKLSQQTTLKIVSKTPDLKGNFFLVCDALPHAFNYFCKDKIKNKKSYFIDTSTRQKILLFVDMPNHINVTNADKLELKKLSQQFQDLFIGLESQYIQGIAKNYPLYEFNQLLNLKQNSLI